MTETNDLTILLTITINTPKLKPISPEIIKLPIIKLPSSPATNNNKDIKEIETKTTPQTPPVDDEGGGDTHTLTHKTKNLHEYAVGIKPIMEWLILIMTSK